MTLLAVGLVIVLSSPLGFFVCQRVACPTTPDPEYQAYWVPPMLLITVAHRPFAMLPCRRVAEGTGVATWAC